MPFSYSVSKFLKKNGTPPVIDRCRGDFLDSMLIPSRKRSREPKRESERRVGISSERCSMRVGAKLSMIVLRCLPEKDSGLGVTELRYSE